MAGRRGAQHRLQATVLSALPGVDGKRRGSRLMCRSVGFDTMHVRVGLPPSRATALQTCRTQDSEWPCELTNGRWPLRSGPLLQHMAVWARSSSVTSAAASSTLLTLTGLSLYLMSAAVRARRSVQPRRPSARRRPRSASTSLTRCFSKLGLHQCVTRCGPLWHVPMASCCLRGGDVRRGRLKLCVGLLRASGARST